jgi:dienelactone hydrolase
MARVSVPFFLAFVVFALGGCAAAPNRQPPQNFMRVAHPGGAGPHPAIVLVPGCGGVGAHIGEAARRFAAAGAVTVTFDYPAARGLSASCPGFDPLSLAGDIATAAALAHAQPDVAPTRVHLVGWAEGGAAVMAALGATPGGIQSAAAYYPNCGVLRSWRAPVPVLLMLADEDRVAPAQTCIALTDGSVDAGKVLAIRYGKAGHGFDVPAEGAVSRWTFWRAGPATHFDAQVREAAWTDLRLFFDFK